MSFRKLKHKEIDKAWWDAQIDACNNALIYAKSWYLDALCPGWEAVVFGENEAFLPLPIKRYFGLFKVSLQPLLSQQLGVFYKSKLPSFSEFKAATKGLLKIHMNLNHGNFFPGEERVNYVLDLSNDYSSILAHYSKDALKNLKKMNSFEWLEPSFSVAKFNLLVSTYRSQYGAKEGFDAKKEKLLKGLLFAAYQNKSLQYYELTDDLNEVLFSGVTLKDKKRIYYLFAAPTIAGRRASIAHHFIDGLIQRHAGQNLLLDFEGSMIPSVAKFYKKWGSTQEIYRVFKSGLK